MNAYTKRRRKDRASKHSGYQSGKDVGELWGKRDVSRDDESTRDIAGMARSLGFSSSEVLEIERLYLIAPKHNQDERQDSNPGRDDSSVK
ncbi:hypothetical protein [Hoeflea prorocentri]|uniref:Uncharacterized protein n=1 Tax=Hoeflea prorocentri TaxID=1922333 RepID=A0A9X3UH61_9HYPH|nr:hypothetical protein [Hoeflea prorocentri]MCY6380770.1 hypothetical protein [Hoeflea prorocentri]MDA5398570.1 hypothetical protein [Hoeflea prorocentri]